MNREKLEALYDQSSPEGRRRLVWLLALQEHIPFRVDFDKLNADADALLEVSRASVGSGT